MRLPSEVEDLFPNKVELLNKMRGLERDMKSYVQSKMLNLKEDVLAGNASVKRMVKVLVEVDPFVEADAWVIRIQGRVEDGGDLSLTKFLSVFERVKVEFRTSESGASYMPVQWTKSKSQAGSSFDGITIQRKYPPAVDELVANISFYVENHPQKYRLSDHLAKVLVFHEETRVRVVAALWQYIKSNRLQDPEERRFINLN